MSVETNSSGLVRSLSLSQAIMIGVASMIGGAIFVLVGPGISAAGPALIIAFLLNGIITLFTALTYAELGSALPATGGGYKWIREGLPRPNAYLSGWMAWFAHTIAGSLYAVAFGTFFGHLLESAEIISNPTGIPLDKLFAAIAIIIFAFVNIRGSSHTGKVGSAITFSQLAIIAGLIVGVVRHGMELTGANGAVQRYTLLTIGDGLVSQLPSLIISIASGILISRSSESSNFGRSLAAQFLLQTRPLYISSGALALLGITLGSSAFFFLSAIIGGSAYISSRAETAELEELPPAQDEETPEEDLTPIEQASDDLEVEPIHLNVGYNIIPLITPSEGGDMLNRIKQIRSTLAQELGIVLPHIRIRDQVDLAAGGYIIMIREEPMAEGELRVNDFLAMDVGSVVEEIDGIPTEEPANNQPALWITEEQREQALVAGYLVIEPSTILATHLLETIKKHADKLLTRQDVRNLLDRVKETNEVLVEEVTTSSIGLGLIQKVLQTLLKEGVSIRDLVLILEAIADHAATSQDVVLLTEAVRQRIGSQICRQYQSSEGELEYVGLDEQVDQIIRSAITQTETGQFEFMPLDPNLALELVNAIANTVTQVSGLHAIPLILCSSSVVRAYLSQFISIQFPTPIPVLSIEEIPATVPLNEIGRVELGIS